jgi:hypothetical protein
VQANVFFDEESLSKDKTENPAHTSNWTKRKPRAKRDTLETALVTCRAPFSFSTMMSRVLFFAALCVAVVASARIPAVTGASRVRAFLLSRPLESWSSSKKQQRSLHTSPSKDLTRGLAPPPFPLDPHHHRARRRRRRRLRRQQAEPQVGASHRWCALRPPAKERRRHRH